MKKSALLLFFITQLFSQDILTKYDQWMTPAGSARSVSARLITGTSERSLSWTVWYKKDSAALRFDLPEFIENDFALRVNNLVSFKYAQWIKADRMGPGARVNDSFLTWEDILCLPLAQDYTIVSAQTNADTIEILLKAGTTSSRPPLRLVLSKDTLPLKTEMLSASGEIISRFEYSQIVTRAGKIISAKITAGNFSADGKIELNIQESTQAWPAGLVNSLKSVR